MFNGWVKAGFRPKLTLDQRPGGLFISLLCRPAAVAVKSRPAKRANAKRLEKRRARRASQQREQQAVATAASAVAPAAITPSCEVQQPATVAATAALSSAAAAAAPIPPATTTAPQPATTVASPARSKAIVSIQNVVRRETRSTSKKRKVETPSDSDPATPEGGSFPLLSQLDGANLDIQSPTPPTPVPVPPDYKKSQDCELWTKVRPPRQNPG